MLEYSGMALTPKVNFVVDAKEVASEMISFVTEDNLFNDLAIETLHDHPELNEKLVDQTLDKQQEIITDYVLDYYKNHAKEFDSTKLALQDSWESKEVVVTERLADILNTTWTEGKTATCFLGILNLYPRNLDNWTFHVHYLDPTNQLLAVILHELTHFIYFKKWSELFPEDGSKTYEAPHKFWHLSEVMAAVLNTDQTLRSLIPEADNVDDPSYKKIPVSKGNQQTIYDFFLTNYREFIENGKTIEDYLKFARQEALKIDFGY